MIQNQLLAKVPIEQEVPQDQSGTNDQDSEFGKLVSAAERSNQHNLVVEKDGSTMPSNSKNDTAEDSVQMVRYMACENFLMIYTCGN